MFKNKKIKLSGKDILQEMHYFPEIREITEHKIFRQMKNYRHHGDINCLNHSLSVAGYSYITAKNLNLDYISAARAALLHDLYLYDWRTQGPRLHGFRHPAISLENALKYFRLNIIEKDAILKHMWPLTPLPPRFQESYVVSYADKKITCKDYGITIKNLFKFA